MWRSEKVSGFAEGFKATSGENSWTCFAKPWASTANLAEAPFFSAGTRSEPVLPVGVDDDAGDLVAEQLLDEHAEEVALPAAGLRKDRDVALDELVDVELDPQGVVAEESDVGPGVPTVLEAEHLGDQRLFGPVDPGARPERDRRDLDETLAVPEPDDLRDAEEPFMDRRRDLPAPDLVGPLEVEVARPVEVVKLAEDPAVGFVLDGEVISALDRVGEADLEVPQPDVAEDDADLVHGVSSEEAVISVTRDSNRVPVGRLADRPWGCCGPVAPVRRLPPDGRSRARSTVRERLYPRLFQTGYILRIRWMVPR